MESSASAAFTLRFYVLKYVCFADNNAVRVYRFVSAVLRPNSSAPLTAGRKQLSAAVRSAVGAVEKSLFRNRSTVPAAGWSTLRGLRTHPLPATGYSLSFRTLDLGSNWFLHGRITASVVFLPCLLLWYSVS